jgi:hypothetical protein
VAVGFGTHAHRAVAVAEVEGVVFLDGDHGAEIDVLGLVGDAKSTRADYTQDAVAAVENCIDRQTQAVVQDLLPSSLVDEQSQQEELSPDMNCPTWTIHDLHFNCIALSAPLFPEKQR